MEQARLLHVLFRTNSSAQLRTSASVAKDPTSF